MKKNHLRFYNLTELKLVYKTKRDTKGAEIKKKTRCVVRGFLQIKGIDYFKCHSSVVRKESLRILCALAASQGKRIYQADIKNAYPFSSLEEDIYCHPPECVELLSEEQKRKVMPPPGYTLKLKRSLYGLKQSGRNWQKMLRSILEKLGYKQTRPEPCLYVNTKEKGPQYIAVYVDDLAIAANNYEEYKTLIDEINKVVTIVELGESKEILGIEIKQSAQGIFLRQTGYIQETYKQYVSDFEEEMDTPMVSSVYDSTREGAQKGQPITDHSYRALIGRLLYISEWTRPDVAFAVNYMSRFNNQPTTTHMKIAKRIVKYLHHTRQQGIMYPMGMSSKIHAQCDSDYASDQNDRKSTSGFIIFMDKSPINWKSMKQTSTALSSTHAEYIAAAECVRELTFITNTLTDMIKTQQHPIVLESDSQCAIKIAEQEGSHKRSKHIDVRYHYLKEEIENGRIIMKYVSTDKNTADLLTKPLSKNTHNTHTRKLLHDHV